MFPSHYGSIFHSSGVLPSIRLSEGSQYSNMNEVKSRHLTFANVAGIGLYRGFRPFPIV